MIFSPIFPFLAVMTLSVNQGKEQSAVFNKTTAVEDVAEPAGSKTARDSLPVDLEPRHELTVLHQHLNDTPQAPGQSEADRTRTNRGPETPGLSSK